MGRRLSSCLALFGLLGVVTCTVAAAAMIWVLSGGMDLAASTSHHPATRWLMHTSFQQWATRGGRGVSVPADLAADGRVLSGARGFTQMCSTCHTPPGLTDTPTAAGLNPAPPTLARISTHLDAGAQFWVIDRGVRMTGMPAFGPTHDAAMLWDIVAFLQHIAKAPADDPGAMRRRYSDSVATAEASAIADDGHDHRHGPSLGNQGHDHNTAHAQPGEGPDDNSTSPQVHPHDSGTRGSKKNHAHDSDHDHNHDHEDHDH